jgi:branched-chain amino acid transport system permease protein
MTALKLDRRTWFVIVLLAALALLPLVAIATDSDYQIAQFRRILIFAIAAVSLDLILGYGGMVSLGHAAFFGVGAYIVAILNWHAAREVPLFGMMLGTHNVLVTWTAAVVLSGALAGLIGLVSLRTTGIYFIMITLAFAQMVYFFFVSLRAYGGDDGLRFPGDTVVLGLIDTENDVAFYYLVFGILCAVLYATRRLVNSRFGLVVQGCRENERRMKALGFATFRYKLACFSLAGALAGLAGALFAANESYISPSIMHWTRSGDLIVMVVLGGMGTLVGPVVGAIAFLFLEKTLPDYTEHWMVVFGPILLLLVLFARRGIFGWFLPKEDRHGGHH